MAGANRDCFQSACKAGLRPGAHKSNCGWMVVVEVDMI